MSLSFEEALKIRPPDDVIAELSDTEKKSNFDHVKFKAAFAQILSLPMLDIYTDINERCRKAALILITMIEFGYSRKED
jgi:hypothetical protein